MEFLMLLVTAIIATPIVLFVMVMGARTRIRELERAVREQEEKLQSLYTWVDTRWVRRAEESRGTPPAEAPAAAATTPLTEAGGKPDTPMPAQAVPDHVPAMQHDMQRDMQHEIQNEILHDKAPAAAAEPSPEPMATHRPNEQAAGDDSIRLAPHQEAFPEPAPPAWLLQARDWLFGGNLVAKAGLLILFFGVSFLLKYAVARYSVPIELRLAGIALADIGLLLWGWRIRDTRASISLPVQGTALGILMLVTFGAFRLYDLIPSGMAFALLVILTMFTCLLAVLQDAVWLAVFGIVGGFAAPVLASTGQGSHVALFSYYAVLNAGILGIALRRSWRLLNLLGFAFTFLIGTTWGVLRYQPEHYASVQGFLILFFVFYVAIAILYASRQAPRLVHYVDGTLVFGTPLLAVGLQYGLVRDMPFGLAYSALALGLFYIGLTLALWRRRGHTLKLLVESFLALGIVFGTLALPFAFDGRWTSAAWALEGAAIVWVGLRQKQKLAWVFGVLVQVCAWFSYVGWTSGLKAADMGEANLWLGFLLLAASGFAMAMNFRKHARDEDGDAAFAPVVATLATIFLGFAALWLLAGAWSEIYVRGSQHAHTLYVLSAMVVAALLGLLASRLAWDAARFFALVPQVLAGLVFLSLLDFDLNARGHTMTDNLFDTGFLGGLLVALGAGFSSLSFHRQQDGDYTLHARALLGWSAFWWFVYVLGSFNAWSEHILASHNLFSETGWPLIHPVYCVLLALGAPLFARLAARWQWNELRWFAAVAWPGLLYATALVLLKLETRLALPQWPVWLAYASLWLAGEWLLHDGALAGWLHPERHPRLLRALHTLRTVSPWLILWPLGHHLVVLGMQVDTPEQAALLAEGGWFTAGSWSRYLPAWAMMAYVALLIPRARDGRWPTAPVADWYRNVLIPLGALWAVAVAAFWNVTQNGLMAPLPYLPLLNPLDLSTGFAALLAVAAWRVNAADRRLRLEAWLLRDAACAAYVWFNLMLLRTAAHYLDIPYQFEPLFESQFVQAMLSLVWSATALVLMRFAARRLLRTPWIAGAGLLVLVIVKLLFVDFSNAGGIERVVSFVGVGLLMLAIGYLAPFPNEKTSASS